MKRLARASILSRLRDELDKHESWCGETHLQKAAFFLQRATQVPLGYSFILYKHGPFSFDLREDLGAFRADGLLELRPQRYPYGPRLVTTQAGRELQGRFPKTLGKYDADVRRVAGFLGGAGVARLERLATALLLLKEQEGIGDDEAAREMTRLKPHVSAPQAQAAVAEVREFLWSLEPNTVALEA